MIRNNLLIKTVFCNKHPKICTLHACLFVGCMHSQTLRLLQPEFIQTNKQSDFWIRSTFWPRQSGSSCGSHTFLQSSRNVNTATYAACRHAVGPVMLISWDSHLWTTATRPCGVFAECRIWYEPSLSRLKPEVSLQEVSEGVVPT